MTRTIQLCDVEDCDNSGVWVIRFSFKNKPRTQRLCSKHYWEDKCWCTERFNNPECPVHKESIA